MQSSLRSADLESELEALRREIQRAPAMQGDDDTAQSDVTPDTDARSEVERVLADLQTRLNDVADDAEDIITANPFASVAAAFLLGVLVANFMSRGK